MWQNQPDKKTVMGIIKAVQAAAFVKFNAQQSLTEIQDEYRSKTDASMRSYMDSDRSITAFRNEFRRAANDAFNMAAFVAWVDAGNKGGVSEELQAWVNAQIEKEIGFIDGVFAELKRLKKEGTKDQQDNYISQRADGYASTLVGVYNYSKMAGGKDRPGQWIYGDTIEHCDTCRELSGKIHPLSWYVENDYIPQQNGSKTLECGGWQCQCVIVDPETGDVLVP